MKVLIACEFSGNVREAFRQRGHDALSCDLLPSDRPGPHYQGDVRDLLDQHWDLLIAFPPCTYLAVSGLHLNLHNEERAQKTEQALDFFRLLWSSKIKKISIENPRGCIQTKTGIRYSQRIQPYDFGEDASKETWLWLKNLPCLVKTQHIPPRMVNGKPRWANQNDNGQSKLMPRKNRAKNRSVTYQGIADAMAEQWGAE